MQVDIWERSRGGVHLKEQNDTQLPEESAESAIDTRQQTLVNGNDKHQNLSMNEEDSRKVITLLGGLKIHPVMESV